MGAPANSLSRGMGPAMRGRGFNLVGWLLGLFAVALFAIAGWAARLEISPYLIGTSRDALVSQLVSGTAPMGISSEAQSEFLFDCRDALTSVKLRAGPSADLRAAVATCRDAADDIVSDTPSSSIAWFTGAFASIIVGDVDGFNTRLLRAYLTGPNEQWLAELRFALAEDNYSRLEASIIPHYEHDLGLLLSSSQAVDLVTYRYMSATADARARIGSVLAKLPPEIQDRFKSRLERNQRRLLGG